MDFNKVSFKEFEKVSLKATQNMRIGDREIEKGEVVAFFDRIQIFGLDQAKTIVAARGGKMNPARVIWVTNKELTLSFTSGVFSKEQFSLLTNGKLYNLEEYDIEITDNIDLESNENGDIILPDSALSLFIYKKQTGEKLPFTYAKDTHTAHIEEPYCDVFITYTHLKPLQSEFSYGNEIFTEYFELEGRTRIKDDQSGQVITGLIHIPRFRLVSNLSLRLGDNATNPVAADFQGLALPVGSGSNTHTWDFFILRDDIDSDF